MTLIKSTLLILILAGAPIHAQWLDIKPPAIPRTADGKPDLSAPTPRAPDGKPDLSGLWRINDGGYAGDVTSDLKPGDIQPWADALYKKRMDNLGSDSPGTLCLPVGPLYIFGGG